MSEGEQGLQAVETMGISEAHQRNNRPKNKKSKTSTHMFNRRDRHMDKCLFLDKLGPLLRKQSIEGRRSGKSVVAVSSERRKIAKERVKRAANFVRVLKIQRGRQEIHCWKVILATRGFGSGPSRPKSLHALPDA
jgi:hypothetical protein